jgi:hypothetical protein
MRENVFILYLLMCTCGNAVLAAAASPDAPGSTFPGTTAPADPAASMEPNPALLPDAVVKTVMEALQHNDSKNNGIEITFRFASPNNKLVTGPLEHFVQLLQTPQYQPMLNFKSIQYGPVHVEGDAAEQAVRIVDATGATVFYVFQLARQTDGALKNCWMTDSVIRVVPQTQPANPPADDKGQVQT